MAEYVKTTFSNPVLSPKQKEVNELFLAAYHIRPYAGCEFGCPYCDGWIWDGTMSDASILVDEDLPRHLKKELFDIPVEEVIGFTRGEPYQPIEQQYRITRQLLQVLSEQGRPVVILTKSPAVCEDIPILAQIHRRTFAVAVISLVTHDRQLSQQLERRTPSPQDRLKAIAALKEAGIPCGVAIIPVFPHVTDTEVHLTQMFAEIQAVQPDFVVWEPLWILNEQHSGRIHPLLASMDGQIIYRYKKLYGSDQQPSMKYRQNLTHQMLDQCARHGLVPRIPAQIYQETLPTEIVSELQRKNAEFLHQ